MSEESVWVPFSKREEWSDVKPIAQYPEGCPPVCGIAYSERFSETMGYLRAILDSDERSARSLALTEEAIEQNPGNYTAWYFRRRCLEAVGAGVREWEREVDLVRRIAEDNPKNYQLWYHRQAAAEHIGSASGPSELAWCAEMVEDDSKNYHAWSHRQWAVRRFGLWDGEAKYTEECIAADPRNNSAWNHRFFALARGQKRTDEATAEQEVEFAVRFIAKAPNNESPWSYLRGCLVRSGDGRLSSRKRALEIALEFAAKFPACPHCLSLLADIYSETGEEEKRVDALVKLRDSVDTIRKRYWDYLIHNGPKKM